ncbi:energy transducer TonB [Pseudohongiella sp.]|uniref:Protein TonB n=1 Tax=marine sediment metagenome TaxID=412755 RepID=A0A0F9Z1L7_9ZZZZ|nr:energy transducer TonB [Pseudohongiella sp.]HDZ09599.1 energy transducer TonB [Pseudohongiella sp.]HEA62513.1 energy transducer TonB [Pseudohongiella sp.]
MKLISKAAMIAVVAGSSMIAGAAQAQEPAMYSSKNLRAVAQSVPEYPRTAQMSGIEGYTVVEFTVMPDGTVAEPAVRDSSYRGFTRATMAAIENWKFEPVIADAGEAVPVRSVMRFSFVGQ